MCSAPLAAIAKPLPRAWRASEMRAERARSSGGVYRCTKNVRGCVPAVPVDWADWLMTEAVTAWASSPGVYEILTAGDDERVSLLDGEIAAERSRLEVFEAEAIESGSAALARDTRD